MKVRFLFSMQISSFLESQPRHNSHLQERLENHLDQKLRVYFARKTTILKYFVLNPCGLGFFLVGDGFFCCFGLCFVYLCLIFFLI